jgi:uncharacterized DUF497 family protein
MQSEIKPWWDETDFRLLIGSTSIDYDPDKDEINRKQHGYGLESAVFLLQEALLPLHGGIGPLFYSEPVCVDGEIRHQLMTRDEHGSVLFMVTTMRKGETVRVISLRRASKKEQRIYLESLKEFLRLAGVTPKTGDA